MADDVLLPWGLSVNFPGSPKLATKEVSAGRHVLLTSAVDQAGGDATQGNVASGAADSGNPVKVGGKYNATLPTFVDGNRGDLQLDVNGNTRVSMNGQVVAGADAVSNAQTVSLGNVANQTAGSNRLLAVAPAVFNGASWDRLRGNTTGSNVIPPSAGNSWQFAAGASGIVNTTTAATLKAAAGASVRNYLTSLQISHDALGGVTELVIRDGAAGTVIWRGKLQVTAAELPTIVFTNPLFGTANTLLEVAALTAVTGGIYINAQGFVAP